MANLKASIDFGLVHIPVEIVSAQDRGKHISFHMLDSRDNSRIRQKRINENTGKEVEWEDIIKGFEVSEGKYVTFTDEEIDALESESNKSLAIDAFIEKDEIIPEMFENPYYVIPAKGGEKGWVILRDVLQKTDKYAVVQSVLRTREKLGVLYARDNAMVYEILRYPDELKKPSEVLPASVSKVKVSQKEVQMAEKLLDQMSSQFKPTKYKDNFITKLRAAIKQKTTRGKAKQSPQTKEPSPTPKSIDIMDLLEKSLKSAKKSSTKKTGNKRRQAA